MNPTKILITFGFVSNWINCLKSLLFPLKFWLNTTEILASMYFNKSLIIDRKSQIYHHRFTGGALNKTKKINLINCHALKIPTDG